MALALVYLATSAVTVARVGEAQQVLEARLLKPGVGRKNIRPANDKEREREERDPTLAALRPHMPAEAEEVTYFKSAGRVAGDSGWRLQVAFVGNKSFFEAYRRLGGGLSEFEVNGILAVNRGTSTWRKLTDGEGVPSGIGCDFVLEDGSLRAKLDPRHSQILIFSTKFDLSVLEKKRAEKERREGEQKVSAPESLAGF